MANGAVEATPSAEELNAKQEVAVANPLNALKVDAAVASVHKCSHIPVLCRTLSYVKPRKYQTTMKQVRTLKKDNSTGNCSKGSISLSPGPPNDDSGIGMDQSVEVGESPVASCSSDLIGIGHAEQESLRALQRAVAEMEADLNIIDSDGDTIVDSDSDGDTVTAENVNQCMDPEKEVQNAVIEKVHQLLPESLLPLQELLVAPVGRMVQENLKQLQDSTQQPHEMVEEILQTPKGLNFENDGVLVEECLQNLINGAVQEDQVQTEKVKLHDQLQQLTNEPKQLKENKEQRFVRDHFERIERLLHSTPAMLPMKGETMEQQLHQNEEVPLKGIQEEVLPSVGEMLQEPQGQPSTYKTVENEDIMPQGQHDELLEEKAVEEPTSISVPVEEIQKGALKVTSEPAEEIVEFQGEHLQEQPALTSEPLESISNSAEETLTQEEQPAAYALATAERMMDLQEQLFANTDGDDEESIQSDLDDQQDRIRDLISYVNSSMTLEEDGCVRVIISTNSSLEELLQLQDELSQATLNEVEEIRELQQQDQDQQHGQLQSNSNAVEEVLELQQEQMDETLPSTSKAVVGSTTINQQPSASWLLEKFIQTLDNEKNAEQIKKLVEEIIKLQNEQPEELPPTTVQPEQQELSLEVESVSSPRRSCGHSPLLGMSGLRALEGYLDNGILRHLLQPDAAPAEVVPFKQEENILPAASEEALLEQEEILVDEETSQEKPCGKNVCRFRGLLNQLRVYKMPMEIIPLALVGTAFCLLFFYRKF